jgi:uncharacterized membrane protein SpoIIM required for sporulation
MKDPEFTSTILGDSYVTMTKANIEKGDPMAVYKDAHEVEMFLGITLNNLMVAFRTYVTGIFFSIGTIAVLLYNGIMVGCFQFFFIERGLFGESALTIWLHGTLEISSIILAGGAGLTLGSGLLFPGTYSHLQAFQVTAIRSLKIMLGITPIFVLAAIIESFLTRYTDVPDILRLFLILLSALFIIGYFVVYPWMRARSGFDRPLGEVKLPPSLEEPVSIDKIKNNAEILKDTFVFYKKFGGKLISWIALISVLMTMAEFLSADERLEEEFLLLEGWQQFFGNLYYALKTPNLFYFAVNVLGTSLVVHRVFLLLDNETGNHLSGRVRLKGLIQTMAILAMLYALLWGLGGWGVSLIIVSFVFFLVFCFTQFRENSDLVTGIMKTWKLASEGFGQTMGLQLILLMMSFSFLIILSAPLLYMNISVLEWSFAESDAWPRKILRFIEIFLKIFAFNLILPIIASSAASVYFSLCEILTAENLKSAIEMVGRKSTKGVRQ